MPIIKSAKKRTRIAKKANIRNVRTKRSLKNALKSFAASLAGDKSKAAGSLSKAQSALDTAVKKGVIHKNKAARKKRQLAAQSKAAGVKTTSFAKKTAVKKPASKKPAVKKAPAKKPATKK